MLASRSARTRVVLYHEHGQLFFAGRGLQTFRGDRGGRFQAQKCGVLAVHLNAFLRNSSTTNMDSSITAPAPSPDRSQAHAHTFGIYSAGWRGDSRAYLTSLAFLVRALSSFRKAASRPRLPPSSPVEAWHSETIVSCWGRRYKAKRAPCKFSIVFVFV